MFTKSRLICSRVQIRRTFFVFSSRILPLRVSVNVFKFSSRLKYFPFGCNCNRAKTTMDVPLMKPLNVLVYTGEDFKSGDRILYNNIAKNIHSCLHPDCYTIYLLTPAQVLEDPWQENLTLLVIACESLTENIVESFRKYIMNGGKMLNFGSNFALPGIEFKEQNSKTLITLKYKDLNNVSAFTCKYLFHCSLPHSSLVPDIEGNPRIIKVSIKNDIVVVSDVHLGIDANALGCDESTSDVLNRSNDDRLDILHDILSVHFNLFCFKREELKHSACFLLSRSNIDPVSFENSYHLTFRKLQLKFYNYVGVESKPVTTEKELPVFYNVPDKVYSSRFNKEIYFSSLTTNSMGQLVFFSDVVGTTMAIVQSLPDVDGAVVVARRQTQGKGRRGNSWITPDGAAAFSAHFSFPLASFLGQKLPIIQHFVALSLVKAIRDVPGYENLSIQIKWPNDIYYARQSKIGGLLVNSTIHGNIVHVYTGCGLNISNSKPTMCLHDIIKLHNSNTGENLPLLSIEEFIARSLNELEQILINYQTNDANYFFSLYYKYWMHSGQQVTLNSINKLVTIVGIDEFGFLLVETANKKKIALQPDGNSFDIMKNLIIVREM